MQTGSPTPGDVVAANLRAMRKRRDLTVRELSARLEAVGYRLLPSAVAKVEQEDRSKRRGVDIDDLVALAVALETSPAFLLAPDEDERVAVAGERVEDGVAMTKWLLGEDTLGTDDDLEAFLSAAPAWVRRGRSAGRHPAVSAIVALHAYARQAVSDLEDVPDPVALAEGLRRQLGTVTRYLELLTEELEQQAAAEGQQASSR